MVALSPRSELAAADVAEAVQVLAAASAELASPDQKRRAQRICEQAHAQGWPLYLQLLAGAESLPLRFWCFSGLRDLVDGCKGPRLDDLGSEALRSAMPTWAGRATDPAERNKLAALHLSLARRDYPDTWPTAFADAFASDDFAFRVLTLLVEDCADDPERAELLRAFARLELRRVCEWTVRGDPGAGCRPLVLAGLAAFLPKGVLRDFPFPATADRYRVAVKILERAGTQEAAGARSLLLLELLSAWPCLRWVEEHAHDDREQAAELCCTMAETLWTTSADLSVEANLRSSAWAALKRLLPSCFRFYCSSNREFRIADSLEEFFSLVFSTPTADVPETDAHEWLTTVLDGSFTHYVLPRWVEELDPDHDDYIGFFEFKRDIKQMLKKMHRFSPRTFEEHLRGRLLAGRLHAQPEHLEGALCILCDVVGPREPRRWKDVVAVAVTRAPAAAPRSLTSAVLDVMGKFAAAIDAEDLPHALEVVTSYIKHPCHASQGCAALERIVESHQRDVAAFAGQMHTHLAPLLGPTCGGSSMNRQTLCKTFGVLCAAMGEDLRYLNVCLFLRSLLQPLASAEDAAVACNCIHSVASFLHGLGKAIGPTWAEWPEMLRGIQQAALRCPAGREVAVALSSLGWRATALPSNLLLPFLASTWGIIVQDDLHWSLATRLLRVATPGAAAEFVDTAVATGIGACKVDDMDAPAWAQLLECVGVAAQLCPGSALWRDPRLHAAMLGALSQAPGHLVSQQAVQTWGVLIALGLRPPAELLGGLLACARLARRELDCDSIPVLREVCGCIKLLYKQQDLQASVVEALCHPHRDHHTSVFQMLNDPNEQVFLEWFAARLELEAAPAG